MHLRPDQHAIKPLEAMQILDNQAKAKVEVVPIIAVRVAAVSKTSSEAVVKMVIAVIETTSVKSAAASVDHLACVCQKAHKPL